MQLRYAGVDQHARIGMVDDVHVDRHPLALGEKVGNEDWRDGDRGGGGLLLPSAPPSGARRAKGSYTRPVQTSGVGGIEKRTSSCMSAARPSASARSLHST